MTVTMKKSLHLFCRIFLVAINIIFSLEGLALLSLGAIVLSGDTLTGGYIGPLIKSLAEWSSLMYVMIALVLVGTFLFLVATVAFMTACCLSRCLIVTYVAVMIVIVVAEIAAIVFSAGTSNLLNNELQKSLQTSIYDNYFGPTSNGDVTTAWNYIFVTYKCCGVLSYTDLSVTDAPNWSRSPGEVVPESCCTTTGSFPDYTVNDITCPTSPTDGNSYWKTGCLDIITNKIDNYVKYIVYIGPVVLILQIGAIVAAVIVCRAHGSQKRSVKPQKEQ